MKKFIKILPLLSAALAIVAFGMLFTTAAAFKSDSGVSYTGIEVSFGYVDKGKSDAGLYLHEFNSTFTGAAIIFLLCGAIAFALAAFSQGFIKNGQAETVLSILASVFLLAAGILFFLIIECCSLEPPAEKGELQLGIGSIIGGIASLLAAICSAVVVIFKLCNKNKAKKQA